MVQDHKVLMVLDHKYWNIYISCTCKCSFLGYFEGLERGSAVKGFNFAGSLFNKSKITLEFLREFDLIQCTILISREFNFVKLQLLKN